MDETDPIYGVTRIHPLGLATVLVLGIALLLLPRRYALFPMIILSSFIPAAQRFVLMGADFDLLRILTLFGWVRLLIRNEFRGFVWNRVDTFFLTWMFFGTAINTIQNGTTSAFINRCGWMFDGLGMYFLIRCVLCDWQDMVRISKFFVIVSIPVAVLFAVEWFTGRNVFSVFGGVAAMTLIRDGKLRCHGAYSHPILAGCFWASIIPWMIGSARVDNKLIALCGVAPAAFIVVACNSSTPIMACIFVLIGMALYVVRHQMRLVRWGLFVTLLFLHLVREKPVWNLISRVDIVSGSTGWHRYAIMDATINNFSKWWLLGEPDPLSWGVSNMNDVTNQYIIEALRGGLVTLVLFVAIIAASFQLVGKTIHALEGNRAQSFFVWCIGVSLFAHVCNFFAVAYFGQIIMVFYLTIGMIGSLPRTTRLISNECLVEIRDPN